MSKTIKIIDLLNKTANGEEVPRKIKYAEKDFKKAIKLNYITVKTEKGLDYLQEI